jgi:hypothetical protein
MSNDIKRYIDLRNSLLKEKATLENRLRQINSALGESGSISQPAQTTTTSSIPTSSSRRRGGRRPSGGLSLRDAVLQVTSRGPLTKEEILSAVKQLGYKFSTNNPLNSLGVILYGKAPKFKNDGGRFSPAGSASASRTQISLQGGKSDGRSKRKLSPEARERIAAAQRARWAKSKSAK